MYAVVGSLCCIDIGTSDIVYLKNFRNEINSIFLWEYFARLIFKNNFILMIISLNSVLIHPFATWDWITKLNLCTIIAYLIATIRLES